MRLHAGARRHVEAQGNITYEGVKRAADANGTSVEETLATIARTAEQDRSDHPEEYEVAA